MDPFDLTHAETRAGFGSRAGSLRLPRARWWFGGFFAAGAALLSACAGSTMPPPRVVSELDLDRYQGTWHEIARLPFWQQDGCWDTTATYSVRPDGEVAVVNRCLDGPGGDARTAEGTAWRPDPAHPSKLLVQFFWPFRGDYWVLGLGPQYEWALVGTPSRKYLWILSRTPALDDAVYDDIVALAEAQGFDVSRLLKTPRSVS